MLIGEKKKRNNKNKVLMDGKTIITMYSKGGEYVINKMS